PLLIENNIPIKRAIFSKSRHGAYHPVAFYPKFLGLFRIKRILPYSIGKWIKGVVNRCNSAIFKVAARDLVLIRDNCGPDGSSRRLGYFFKLGRGKTCLGASFANRLE